MCVCVCVLVCGGFLWLPFYLSSLELSIKEREREREREREMPAMIITILSHDKLMVEATPGNMFVSITHVMATLLARVNKV